MSNPRSIATAQTSAAAAPAAYAGRMLCAESTDESTLAGLSKMATRLGKKKGGCDAL
jgi:hypothetical protein